MGEAAKEFGFPLKAGLSLPATRWRPAVELRPPVLAAPVGSKGQGSSAPR
jgi:hypothetical protein